METIMPKKHQIKSSRYYWFWGLCTVAVCAGQLYVGSGYRKMSKSFDRIMDTIVITIEDEWDRRPPRHPMLIDPPMFDHWKDSSEYDG